MARGAHVEELAALSRFRNALERFRTETQEAVGMARRDAAEARDWVNDQQRGAAVEIDYWEDRLRSLRNELSYADDSDSGDIEGAIDDACWQLREASEQLERVRSWSRRLQQEEDSFYGCATRLNHLSSETISHGQALLAQKLELLERYVGDRVGAEPMVGRAAPASRSSSHGYPESLAKRGFRDVALDRIDTSDSPVKSSDDFRKGASCALVESECRDLEKMVRPAVKRGAGLDRFRSLDANRRSPGNTRLGDIYNWFFGQRPIRLVHQNGRYIVENGYHRIFAARRAGVRTLPVVVVER